MLNRVATAYGVICTLLEVWVRVRAVAVKVKLKVRGCARQ